MLRTATLIAAVTTFAVAAGAADNFISIRGSNIVGQPIAQAATAMKAAIEVEYRVVNDSSQAAIGSMAEGILDIALSTRPLLPDERANWPKNTFTETLIGKQAVIFVVPKQVWEGGVQALTKQQFRQIYEGEIKNWKDVGGPDRAITFYNREVGRGVWELAMIFMYNEVRRAPLSKAEVLVEAKEVVTTVEFSGSSISMLEFGAYEPGPFVHALGIKLADGSVVEPTAANIATGKYEIARPLLLITSKRPTGKVREFIEFMKGKAGQEFVKKALHVPLADLNVE